MSDRASLFALFNEIAIINQLANTAFASGLPAGMTLAQFGVLNHFVRLDPGAVPPKDLASAFQVTRATMTSTLTRMERSELVEIVPNPDDGRGKLVSITAEGREMREQCIMRLQEPMKEAEQVVDVEEVEALLPHLTSLRSKLDNLRD